MRMIVNAGVILFVLWLAMQVVGVCLEIAKQVRENFRPENIRKRRNYIVIDGKRYWPRRTGRNVECDKDCKLAHLCPKNGYGLCVTLQCPEDDVIMTDGTDD